jgi:hypothetical protein
MAEPLYTIEDASQHLGVTTKTVRNLIRGGYLTVIKRERDRRKYLDPSEVEEVRVAREAGGRVSVSREEFASLRGQVRRLQATVEVLLRVLDVKDNPLRVTSEYGEKLYVLCLEQVRVGAWSESEIAPWVEVFLRLSEEDLEVIAQATGDRKPWAPFLRLVASMTAWVVGNKDYTTSLSLQAVHKELAEGRRRLRTAAVIYSESAGVLDPGLDKYREYSISSSIGDLLEGILRRKK